MRVFRAVAAIVARSVFWNEFGALVPNVTYQPAECTATDNPDTAPYEGRSFAVAFHTFESKSEILKPDQAATVAQGTVDISTINASVARCVTVTTSDGIPTRFSAVPNPQTDPAQIGAIRTTVGRTGDVVKVTYLAQVNGYTVMAYASCSKAATCEKALTPVFRNGIAKARKA